jgi:transcriptional regulator with XRE-family HTH domain
MEITIGTRLGSAREKRYMTLSRLAKLSHVNRVTISRIEKGLNKTPRFSTLLALATALKCDVSVLTGWYNDKEIQQ